MRWFLVGWFANWTMERQLFKLALSGTEFGKQVRRNVFAKMRQEVLLRIERDVTLELMKRRERNDDGER